MDAACVEEFSALWGSGLITVSFHHCLCWQRCSIWSAVLQHSFSCKGATHLFKVLKALIFSGLCCPLQMPADWIPSTLQSTAYKTSLCPQMTASEQQDISNTLFSYHHPKRPKRNQGEWIERGTGDTMPTCPPSLSSSWPTPLGHHFFASFLFCWQKLSDSSESLHTGRWLDREFLQPRLKTKSNPKSSIFPVLIYFFLFFFFFFYFYS